MGFEPGARRHQLAIAIALIVPAAGCQIQTLPFSPGGTGGGNSSTAGGVGGATQNNGTPVSITSGNTANEQLMLERINRARLNPGAEAARFGIALDEGIPGQLTDFPRQPVAMNPLLSGAARAHSTDMLNRDYFEHVDPDGKSPFDRMLAVGYSYRTAGENLAWRGTTGALDEPSTVETQHRDLFVDEGIADRGHRVVMLHSDFREVGVGIVRGAYTQKGVTYDSLMVTCDFGAVNNSATFVTGAVYDDRNRNGEYDFGEGKANVPVSLGGIGTQTNDGGGYTIAVPQPGSYTLQFSSGGSTSISVGSQNIKVDQVDGTRVVINLGRGPL